MDPFSSFSSASYSSSSSTPPLLCEVNTSSIISPNRFRLINPSVEEKLRNVLLLSLSLNEESDMESPRYVCPFHFDSAGNIILDFFQDPAIANTDEFVDDCVRSHLQPHVTITEDITHFICNCISSFVGSAMVDIREKPITDEGYKLSVFAVIETWEQKSAKQEHQPISNDKDVRAVHA